MVLSFQIPYYYTLFFQFKKHAKEGTKDSKSIQQKQMHKMEELRDELEKVKRRREEREREKAARDEEMSMMQREKESELFSVKLFNF